MTTQMGVDVLNLDRDSLLDVSDVIPTEENPLFAFFQLIINVIGLFSQTFIIFVSVAVSADFLLMSIFLILPMTIVFVYIMFEFARGTA